jgi:hypothetical protein
LYSRKGNKGINVKKDIMDTKKIAKELREKYQFVFVAKLIQSL